MLKIFDNINIIGFDADDTLWKNEPHYRKTEKELCYLLQNYLPADKVSEILFQTEMANLKLLGYGAKSFILSLIETAIKISGEKISASEIQKIINLGKSLIDQPIDLLPDVENVLTSLYNHYKLIIITKGDLLDQETKLAKSGLKKYFHHIEIVSDKNSKVYSEILRKLNINPIEFLMVGNSLKSDILPITNIGAFGIYIPYHTTWQHEVVSESNDKQNSYLHVDKISKIVDLLI